METLLKPKEAAAILNVSMLELYRLIHRRDGIPAIKTGRREYRIDPDALRAWISARTKLGDQE